MESDRNYFGETFPETVAALEAEGVLKKRFAAWHLTPQISNPARNVSIRSASNINYAVLDASHGYAMMEEVSDSNAFFQLHEGAVYLHQGDPYFVKQLDIEKHIAIVEPSRVPYYTQCNDVTDLHIIKMLREKKVGDVNVCFGKVDVNTRVLGYKKKMHYTEEVVGDEILELPPMQFVTESLWFDIPQKAIDAVVALKRDHAGGLHAAEHAAIALLPLFALCDRNDIGGVSTPFHPDTARAQIFIYDAYPGGIGIAARGYDSITELWSATLKAIRECPCAAGCPSCVQSPKCGNNNDPLDKQAAIILLEKLLQE
jgi:DEAD/DEAH box helicase domain-containing protein